ncbi:Sua5 YciO YrdC YwlC family protein [Helicobacter japonicus]|uniref:Sua5 YciO YrdC YwlC family protein n=1 Tax=Helicobacter japonicus TaxID=425400 RepID=UPI0023F17B6A|nr:Sua5 YciO YrdC YwlC family protein [Helicobacter japonicus]
MRRTQNTAQYRPLIYLAQCDTTAGLLSENPQILNSVKNRPKYQNILMQISSLHILKIHTRIPAAHKNRVRKSKLCTFIYPNQKALRVIKDKYHLQFFAPFTALYSTSANLTRCSFNQQWAEEICDVIVRDKRGVYENQGSKIYKINQHKIKRIR